MPTGYCEANATASTSGSSPFIASAGTRHECVDDGTRQPTAPANTTSDVITDGRGVASGTGEVVFDMGTLESVDAVSAVKIWCYAHKSTPQVSELLVSVKPNGGAFATNVGSGGLSTTKGWLSFDFTGLSWSQSELDGFQVRLQHVGAGTGKNSSSVLIYAMYAEVTYTEPSGGGGGGAFAGIIRTIRAGGGRNYG
jgi:hypothetical protein